jgi:hypothetical protein
MHSHWVITSYWIKNKFQQAEQNKDSINNIN